MFDTSAAIAEVYSSRRGARMPIRLLFMGTRAGVESTGEGSGAEANAAKTQNILLPRTIWMTVQNLAI
jgi:hypothetical protein